MQDALANQAALEEARIEGVRQAILLQGLAKFGEPLAASQARLAAIKDRKGLEQLCLKIFRAESWQELLETELEARMNASVNRISMTYQATLEDGRVEGAQEMVLILGAQRFGDPDRASRETIAAIKNRERLERISEAVFTVNSWQQVLDTP